MGLPIPQSDPNLVAGHPGAVIVHIHCDIVETLTYGFSLFVVYRSTHCDAIHRISADSWPTITRRTRLTATATATATLRAISGLTRTSCVCRLRTASASSVV